MDRDERVMGVIFVVYVAVVLYALMAIIEIAAIGAEDNWLTRGLVTLVWAVVAIPAGLGVWKGWKS